MSITVAFLILVVCFAILAKCADWFVDGAVGIAEHFNVMSREAAVDHILNWRENRAHIRDLVVVFICKKRSTDQWVRDMFAHVTSRRILRTCRLAKKEDV